jgi:hypothetical protein
MTEYNKQVNQSINRQLIRNAAVYYACYELSKRGWNAIPTSKNSRGIDIVIYDKKGREMHTIKVKSSSSDGRFDVLLGMKPTNLLTEYVIIVKDVISTPEVYILDSDTVRRVLDSETVMKGLTSSILKGSRQGYFLPYEVYKDFKDRWDLIGE